MTTATQYHPDAEINEDIVRDAEAAELANIAAGYPASEWECECGARHGRGPVPMGGHRCLRCGFIGLGGRLIDPNPYPEGVGLGDPEVTR